MANLLKGDFEVLGFVLIYLHLGAHAHTSNITYIKYAFLESLF